MNPDNQKSRPAKPKRPRSKAPNADNAGESRGERLQKVLAAAGLGSRRSCEELILAGRVEVDRQPVSELGVRVSAEQEVRVDGEKLARPRRVYYALHKPAGVVSTNRDPAGRPRVIDLIDSHERLFAVGRLDKSSEGLILLTNDGDLAQRMTHPKYEVAKTYRVEVAGKLELADIEKLRGGIHLAEGFARVADVRIRKTHSRSTELEMVLKEGRNREVRRLLAAIGHKVERLTRIAIGPLRLGELPAGAHRTLSRDEVKKLQEAATEERKRSGKAKGKAAKGPRGTGEERQRRAPVSREPALGVIIGGEVSEKKNRPAGKPAGRVGQSKKPGGGPRFSKGKRPAPGRGRAGQ